MIKHPTPKKSGGKLPKRFWEKGKSKYIDIRMHEEGVYNINQLYFKLIRREEWRASWLYRLIQYFKNLFLSRDYPVKN